MKESANALSMETSMHGRFPMESSPLENIVRIAGAWRGWVRSMKHIATSQSCQFMGSVSNYSRRWSSEVDLFKGAERNCHFSFAW